LAINIVIYISANKVYVMYVMACFEINILEGMLGNVRLANGYDGCQNETWCKQFILGIH